LIDRIEGTTNRFAHLAVATNDAGPLARALALAIDEALRWIVIVCATIALAWTGRLSVVWLMWLVPLAYWGYGFAFETFGGGQTPGKRALGLRVVAMDGGAVGALASSIRNVALLVDALPFAYLLGLATMVSTRQFRRLGDLAGGTRVEYADDVVEPWRYADLGLEAVRRSPVRFYGAWLVGGLTVAALTVLLWWDSPGLAGFALWWFKPLYERLPAWLYWRSTLEKGPPNLASARSAWRVASRGLLAMLTYRRLAPRRSFDAAMDVVEGLRGSARRGRVLVLHRADADPAVWLTIVGVHIEAFLTTAAILELSWFVLGPLIFDIGALVAASIDPIFEWQANLLYFVAIAIVGPVYAAGGAALYLRRCDGLTSGRIEGG